MLVLSRLRVSCSWGARRPEYWSVPSCRGTRSRVTPHGCHTRGGQGPAPPPTLRLIRVSPAGPLTPFLIAGASPGSRVAFHSLWPLVFLTFMALRLPKCPGQAPCGASFRWRKKFHSLIFLDSLVPTGTLCFKISGKPGLRVLKGQHFPLSWISTLPGWLFIFCQLPLRVADIGRRPRP